VTTELELLHRLYSTPKVFDAIAELGSNDLAAQQQLRREFDADVVRAALALSDARQRAAGTLAIAASLWLTGTGLEQATHPLIAEHKASRFPGDFPVWDLCSGIGCDASALAARGPVVAFDSDEAMLQRCRWNLEAWGAANVTCRHDDATSIDISDKWIHVDPDRRNGRSRPTKRLERYSPDLKWMQHAVQKAKGGAIKIGPASNFMQKFPDCEIELISLHKECREATVWFGELADCEQFRATILPSGETIAGDPLSAYADAAAQPLKYIYDPDPAVVRSGLIDAVCAQLNLQRLDSEEEYLTSDEAPETSFVTSFEVEAVLPNNQKQLRRYLRQSPGQYYEVKCRRLPIDASATTRRLPTDGDTPKVIFFLRVQGKAKIVVARRF
jgi:hypothetical protein